MSKTLRLLCFIFAFCGNVKAEGMPFGFMNVMQAASFHYGYALDSTDSSSSILGASIGWNIFSDTRLNPNPCISMNDNCAGFGVRIKYLYMDTYAPTHSVGALFYLYLEETRLFPIAFGIGANFSKQGDKHANGVYIEVGGALFKMLPFLLNTDILYRINFYGDSNELGLGTTHSIHFVWTLL